tara:strand:- start:216 stop:2396 length:2181 start_codon:yes stop_codon:yes gene_type:complete
MARYDTYGAQDDRLAEDLDQGFTGFNNKFRPDQLTSGILAESNNGRMDLNGEWQPRKGTEIFSAPFTAAVLALPFKLYDSTNIGGGVASFTRSSSTITVNFNSAHNITTSTGVNISGLTFSGSVDPNGNFIATVVDADTITYTVTDLAETPGGTMVVKGMRLLDSASNFIEASCEFSDPNNDATCYIAVVGTNKTVLVKTSDSGATTVTLTYPSGETVPRGSNVVQAFNKLFIFRKGKIALQWDGDISTTTFSLVSNGNFNQPVPLSITDLDFSGGIGTATVSSTASLLVGDLLKVTTAGTSGYSIGDTFRVRGITNSTTFTFNSGDKTGTNKTASVMKPESVGLGFTHMPAPEFGVPHQRRLVVPYQFDITGSSGSATITDRNILDEALFSDILDQNTYDRIYGQFRFNAGESDFIVGFHSFSDDQLVVFNRNSIHTVKNSLDLGSSISQVITSDIGCLARNSIQQIGNKLMFLSDNGVYALDFVDLYNLRGQDVPLSASIQGTISRINKDHADKAVSAYFDNRYYIAVPLDDSTTNNALLVYNFLNKQWESLDSINDSDWEYTYLLAGGSGSQRGVYAINRNGGVHKYESRVDDIDLYVGAIGASSSSILVSASAITRMFNVRSIDRKKWNNFELHLQSSENNVSDANLEAITENIDGIIDLGSVSSLNGQELAIDEDVSLRGRFGNKRAYGLQFKLTTTKGRPRLRALKVAGAITFRNLQKAE